MNFRVALSGRQTKNTEKIFGAMIGHMEIQRGQFSAKQMVPAFLSSSSSISSYVYRTMQDR